MKEEGAEEVVGHGTEEGVELAGLGFLEVRVLRGGCGGGVGWGRVELEQSVGEGVPLSTNRASSTILETALAKAVDNCNRQRGKNLLLEIPLARSFSLAKDASCNNQLLKGSPIRPQVSIDAVVTLLPSEAGYLFCLTSLAMELANPSMSAACRTYILAPGCLTDTSRMDSPKLADQATTSRIASSN